MQTLPTTQFKTKQNAITTCLFIGISFLWTGSSYLTWMYKVSDVFSLLHTDLLTEVIGYLFQVIGILLFSLFLQKKISRLRQSHRLFAGILLLDLCCLLLSVLTGSSVLVLIFGYLMNILHGCIAGFYLFCLSFMVPQQNRAIVFGTGYAFGSIGTWLLSLIGTSNFLRSPFVFPVYFILAFLSVILIAGNTEIKDPFEESTKVPFDQKFLVLTCATVLLLSLVKSVGFFFPSADLSEGFSLEFSRIFYAFGLIIAGLINDKNRKYGAQCCLAALIFPLMLFLMREQLVASWILWAFGYLFFGFFTVYRVIVFSDLSGKKGYAGFFAFGLLFGRLGDASGSFAGILLSKNTLLLLGVSAVLFFISVFCFFAFYQAFYYPVLPSEKNEELLLDTFCDRYHFTPREKEVFSLVTNGRSNSEIAGDLFISENTVKYHMRNILGKTTCQNRIELINRFKQQ